VWRRSWKRSGRTTALGQQVVVLRTTARDRVWGLLGVAAVFLAANVGVALDDAGAAEGSAQHALEGDVGAHHLAFLVREHQLRWRALQCLLQVRNKLAGD